MLALELDDVLGERVAKTVVIFAVQGVGDLAREFAGAVLASAAVETEALCKLDQLFTQLVSHGRQDTEPSAP